MSLRHQSYAQDCNCFFPLILNPFNPVASLVMPSFPSWLKLLPLLVIFLPYVAEADSNGDSMSSLPPYDGSSASSNPIVASSPVAMTDGANNNNNDWSAPNVPVPSLANNGRSPDSVSFLTSDSQECQQFDTNNQIPNMRKRNRRRSSCPSKPTGQHSNGNYEQEENKAGSDTEVPSSDMTDLRDFTPSTRMNIKSDSRLCPDSYTIIPVCAPIDKALSDPPGSHYYTVILPRICMYNVFPHHPRALSYVWLKKGKRRS